MKNIHILLYSLVFITISGCSDDILDKLPKESLVEETVFTSNQNFETFSWGFYDVFEGYDLSKFNAEFKGDLMLKGNGNQGDSWLWQRETVPTNSGLWNNSYTNIRRANIMLQNVDKDFLTETESQHWEGVGLFFRAINHINLLVEFGEVPWISTVLTDQSEELFGPRTPRDDLAQNILNDLLTAEAHIRANTNNTIDKNVVRALISRFGLFEGTWRKYHSLGDANTYLQASVAASTQLIADHPSLISKYDLVFNSESLSGQPGILLFKDYVPTQLTNAAASRHRNSAGNWDLTKKAVDKYLLLDGQTRWTSPLFDGDHDPYGEFRNRDRRLYTTTTTPFQVVTNGNSSNTWSYHSNPKFREYLDFMDNFSDPDHKAGPTSNWNAFVIKAEPHFRLFNGGQGFNVTYSGYRSHKFYNQLNTGIQNNDDADAPIFRMGEILVNHAEATFELGLFTQTVADETINKLRVRGEVAALTLGNIAVDPTRDADVPEVLWEIRRERAIELMMEGFRPDDIRRWKKFVKYGSEEKLGRWVKNSDYGNKLPIQGGDSQGYVSPYGVPPGVPEYYYLAPIPSNQIVLNPNLKQNPGWDQ